MQPSQAVPVGLQMVQGPCRATEGQFAYFVKGVDAVLNQWTALHLVARFCDPFALQTLRNDVVEWFHRDGEVYSDELELFFDDFFDGMRAVSIEDDSTKEVGDALHAMYCQCCRNDFSAVGHYLDSLEIFKRNNPVQMSVSQCGELANDDDDDDQGVGPSAIDDDEAGANADEGPDGHPAPQPAKTRNRTKGKNPYKKSSDGWCIVER